MYTKLKCSPKVPNTTVIQKKRNYTLLDVDMKKTTISEVVSRYSDLCEINDINVLSESMDDIIIKLYEDYSL